MADDPSPVDAPTLGLLARLLRPLGELRGAERLEGGFFATTYRATLVGGERLVVKTAPTGDDRLLTYERDLLHAEAEVYRLAADRGLPMPRLRLADFSREVLPGDVVVAEHLEGVPWDRAGLAADDPRSARACREVGAFMARLHAITGTRFGYLGSRVGGGTWPVAFGAVIEALLADGRHWEVALPADEIRDAVARHVDALAEVRVPSLVHGDLWPGNVFVDPASGGLVGVIDPERAQWADPLVELVGFDQSNRGPTPSELLAGYAATGGHLDVSSDRAVRRLALYRVQMSLIWLVETVPRGYEPEFADWYTTTARANLRGALDALA
ncbi:MAG TPA: phosphotransferase [Cellulomonas sp.]